MTSAFKGMMVAIIALSAAAAFLLGLVIPVGGAKGAAQNDNIVANVNSEATGGDETQAETIKDSAGNEFTFPLDANSVITLNDNAADMLYTLGKKDLLTGISDGTNFPSNALSLTRYGTEEKPHTENIIAAAPEAVIASTGFKDSAEYKKLTDSGITVVCFDLDDADTAVDETAKLGLLFDAAGKAEEFITDIENIKALVAEKLGSNSGARVYWEKSDAYTSVGKSENETKILKKANVESITSDKSESDVKTDAAFVKGENPDLIIKESEYGDEALTLENEDIKKAEELVEEIGKRSGLNDVKAVKDKKVLALSERIINTPLGSAIAPLYIAKMAYPDAFKDVTPGQYLNDVLDKYAGDEDYKGALAYEGNLSSDENKKTNLLAKGASSGNSLASLSSSSGSTVGGSVLRSVVSGGTSSAASNTKNTGSSSARNLLNRVAGGNNSGKNTKAANSGNKNSNTNAKNSSNKQSSNNKKQNDLSKTDNTEDIKDSSGRTITVDVDDTGKPSFETCIVFNSHTYNMMKVFQCENLVVGVADSLAESSDYPELANTKKYGKWNNPNAEAIIEAKPDVVFAYGNYGQEGMDKVRAAGITVISLDFYIPSKMDKEIIAFGKMLGNEKLAKEWNKDVNDIQNLVASRTKYAPQVKCYWEGYTNYSSVAPGSGGAEMVDLSGTYNIYDLPANEGGKYPKVSDEWVVEKNPDVILKMCSATTGSDTFCLGSTVYDYSLAKALYNKVASRPGWSEINAIKNNKMILFNSSVGTSPIGCAVCPLYIAKVAYPEKFQGVDADKITRDFYKKYWRADFPGVWRFGYQNFN